MVVAPLPRALLLLLLLLVAGLQGVIVIVVVAEIVDSMLAARTYETGSVRSNRLLICSIRFVWTIRSERSSASKDGNYVVNTGQHDARTQCV